MIRLPSQFRVQIIFQNDLINELDACINPDMITRSEQTTFKLKASMFIEKRRPGRPPKQKEVSIQSDEDLEEVEDDEMMDVENSNRDDRKFTKRQLNNINGMELEYTALPTKSKKNTFTEEDIIRRNLKEIERKEKLVRQQEEQKQQTVDKILNEVGRKQKMRLLEEDKKAENTHIYKSLPPGQTSIKYVSNQEANYLHCPSYFTVEDALQLNLYKLFQSRTMPPKRQVNLCTNCQLKAKYTIPKSTKHACSLPCYKILTLNQ